MPRWRPFAERRASCRSASAPFLESNDETRDAFVQLGIRYRSSAREINRCDRSDASLLEFPISDGLFKERVAVAGDYNLFDGEHLSDDEVVTFLLELYNEHRKSGRPLVILLHPHLAAAHATVFKRVFGHLEDAGVDWTCFRNWLRSGERAGCAPCGMGRCGCDGLRPGRPGGPGAVHGPDRPFGQGV